MSGQTGQSNSSNVRLHSLRNTCYANPIEHMDTFSDVHQFHINSISQSSDVETLISSDDTSVVMWNIERAAME